MTSSSTRTTWLTIAASVLLGTGNTANAEPLPEGNSGIAARYAGDQGIAADPAVVLTDNFEAYGDNRLTVEGSPWDNVWGEIGIVRGATAVHSGSQAVEINHTSPESIGAWKDFGRNGFETLHVRWYMKYDRDFPGLWHTGMNLFGGASGRNQGNSTGVRPDGPSHFFVGLDDLPPFVSWSLPGNQAPGMLMLYVYHMHQGGQYGDNFYPSGLVTPGAPDLFDDTFVARPDIILDRDRWYSFELMARTNTPGQRDGRVAFWVDGELAGDFPGLELRTVESLKANFVALSTYSEFMHANKTLWYDDVVAATSYIGPMASGAPPPPTATAPNPPSRLRIVTTL